MSSESPQRPHFGKRLSQRIDNFEEKLGQKIYDTSKRSLLQIVGVELLGAAFVVIAKHMDKSALEFVLQDVGWGVALASAGVGMIKMFRIASRGPHGLDPDEKL